MRIDRDRFLLLVAGLAACNGAESPPPETPSYGVAVVPQQPPPPAPPPPQPQSQPPPPRPAQPPPPPPPAPVATPANPYDGTPVHAQSCDPAENMVGQAPRCELRPPGPTCESFHDTVQECPTLTRLLKPRAAQAAIECLKRRSGTDAICEFNVTSICAYEALGSACLDPSAKAACDGVIARCGPPHGHYSKMTRESCEAGVSAVADAKRKKFISCISESCRFETCLTYL